MKNPLGTLGAVAAGALVMYYLDPDMGARRRALLADLVRSGLPGSAGRPRGRYVRRTYDRVTHADARSDAELRDRIQDRLGRLVSFPGALQVSVSSGVVRLAGRVLAKEREGLLAQVQAMEGVQKLVNAMTAHDNPQEVASRGAAAAAQAAQAAKA